MPNIVQAGGFNLDVAHPIPTDTKIWLRGDDVAGNDGDAVASWSDHNGGAPFTQSTGGKKPLLKKGVNGVNGHNTILFDGVDDFMAGSTVVMTGKEMTYIYVINNTTFDAASQIVFSPNYDWGGPSGFGMFFYGSAGGPVPGGETALGITYTGVGFGSVDNTGGKVWVSYRKDAVGWTIDGSFGGPTTTHADTNDVFVDDPRIGFTDNPILTPFFLAFPGSIAEMICWNRKLTNTENANVIANLSARYGF